MKLTLKSDTVWIDTMPKLTIGEGGPIAGSGRSLPTIEAAIQPAEVLPEGKYVLEVRLTCPDGRVLTAAKPLVVAHVS